MRNVSWDIPALRISLLFSRIIILASSGTAAASWAALRRLKRADGAESHIYTHKAYKKEDNRRKENTCDTRFRDVANMLMNCCLILLSTLRNRNLFGGYSYITRDISKSGVRIPDNSEMALAQGPLILTRIWRWCLRLAVARVIEKIFPFPHPPAESSVSSQFLSQTARLSVNRLGSKSQPAA